MPSAACSSSAGGATDDARGERRALPQVLVADLGDRCAETARERRADGQQLLALALEAAVVGKVQADRERYEERQRCRSQSSSRSTWRVS